MSRPARALPQNLPHGPFTTRQGAATGVSASMLRGRTFRRLFPRVWVHADHDMSAADWITAARLTLPRDARLTGITRIQELGFDHGPQFPLHFVVARDHHIATHGIKLHRTERLPVCDGQSVSPTAAFMAYCAEALTIDAITVGDWLLHENLMTLPGLLELARHDDWRAGSAQAVWIARYLDANSWSPAESRARAMLVFAGLPSPQTNVEIVVDGRPVAIVDLGYLQWNTVAEYEGAHHQLDRRQYLRDIDRYRLFRDLGLNYVQLTKELTRNPVAVVQTVYAMLRRGGYDGPAPVFSGAWKQLFRRIPAAPPSSSRNRRGR